MYLAKLFSRRYVTTNNEQQHRRELLNIPERREICTVLILVNRNVCSECTDSDIANRDVHTRKLASYYLRGVDRRYLTNVFTEPTKLNKFLDYLCNFSLRLFLVIFPSRC